MNYQTDIQPRKTAGLTNAEIAAEIETRQRNNPANYRPVKSHEVANWLASNGLESRVNKWLATNGDHEHFDVLHSAFEGVKAIRANTEATMRVGPTESHRQLIYLAINVGAMQQIDLESIDSTAYLKPVVTEQSVQSLIDDSNSPRSRWQRATTTVADLLASKNPENIQRAESLIAALEAAIEGSA